MSRQTYAHLRDKLLAFYARRRCAVKIDPPGRGAPDILGKHPDGTVLVGEIKSASEAACSPGRWWEYWTRPERDLRKHYGGMPPETPGALRGWCAVIDGQLREYCNIQSVSEGDLVVEGGARHRDAIQHALQFLKSENRVLSWTHTYDGDLHYWTIRYATGKL